MKKRLFLAIFTLIKFVAQAQDTLYLDENYNVVDSKHQYKYFKLILKSPQDTNAVTEKTFYANGNIMTSDEYYPYYPEADRKLQGQSQNWYESGAMRLSISYYNDKKHGKLYYYWKNGKVKREEIYTEDEMVSGSVWDENGKPVAFYPFEQIANNPGWSQYLIDNLRYPPNARNKNIEGKVIVKFVVEKDGFISNISIIKSVHKDIDAEVIRILKASPRWEPGKQDGIPVRSYRTIPITFKLQ